jgi:phage shock protein B
MDVFTMVVIIVALGVGSTILKTYLETRAAQPRSAADEAELATMREDIKRLKDRVRTLETIVTDKDRALSEEIRKLA